MEEIEVDLYNFIDYLNTRLNDYTKQGKAYKILGIPRTTFFRKLNRVKSYGFQRYYNLDLSALNTILAVFFINMDEHDVELKEILKISSERGKYEPLDILITYSPSYSIIARYIIPSAKLDIIKSSIEDKISNIGSIIDMLIFQSYIRPYLHYSSTKYLLAKPYNAMKRTRRQPDYIDCAIISSILKGYTRISDISYRLLLSPTRVAYHFREHVKKGITNVVWTYSLPINVFLEIVLDNSLEVLTRVINEIFCSEGEESIGGIAYRSYGKLMLALIEVYTKNISNTIGAVYTLAKESRIHSARLFPVQEYTVYGGTP